jgi:hypothetical protein
MVGHSLSGIPDQQNSMCDVGFIKGINELRNIRSDEGLFVAAGQEKRQDEQDDQQP